MYGISRLFTAICLLFIMTSSTGCFRIVKYTTEGKSYLSRTEAEEAERSAQEARLSASQLSHRQISEKCIFVMPTRKWIRETGIRRKGIVPKEDLIDFLITSTQRRMELEYAMIEKSGLFKECEMIQATSGNGEGENISLGKGIEIRTEFVGKKRYHYYWFVGPGQQQSMRIGAGEFYYSAHYGWDWFADQMEELVSK